MEEGHKEDTDLQSDSHSQEGHSHEGGHVHSANCSHNHDEFVANLRRKEEKQEEQLKGIREELNEKWTGNTGNEFKAKWLKLSQERKAQYLMASKELLFKKMSQGNDQDRFVLEVMLPSLTDKNIESKLSKGTNVYQMFDKILTRQGRSKVLQEIKSNPLANQNPNTMQFQVNSVLMFLSRFVMNLLEDDLFPYLDESKPLPSFAIPKQVLPETNSNNNNVAAIANAIASVTQQEKKEDNIVPLGCDVCGKTALELKCCARCKNAWYCSKECQKAAWSVHKTVCGK